MAKHLTAQQVELLIARGLAPTDLLAATRHLASCAACRSQISEAYQISGRLPILQAELQAESRLSHLGYTELAGYADGLLSDESRQVVDDHLAVCANCAVEAQELIALHDSLTAHEAVLAHSPRVWEKLVARWHWAEQWKLGLGKLRLGKLRLAAGMVAALLLAVATVSWLAWRSSHAPRQETASSPPSATTTQSSPILSPAPGAGAPPALGVPVQPTPLPSRAIVAALSDGTGQVTLDEQSNLSGLPALTPADEQLIKQALAHQQVPRAAALAGLTSRASKLMSRQGEGIAFALLSPLSTVIETDRPTFRWQPLTGAGSYTVTVLDENFNVLIVSEPLQRTSWTVSRPLPRGARYLWQVTAQTNTGQQITSPSTPAPEARFQVLGQAQSNELRQAAQTYKQVHLLLGLRYAQAGLLEDAEREFQALLKANPRSPIAANLLQQVQALRR